MTKTLSFVAAAMLCAIATQSFGQNEGFQPVTNDVLANPPPGDWLMINRTYDEQRFSPQQGSRDLRGHDLFPRA